jgi:hypothetical protein
MQDQQIPSVASDGLVLAWSWCSRCRRTYATGTYRVVSFSSTRREPCPRALVLCPYMDCSGSIARDRWRWSTIRQQHPEYPESPVPNVTYRNEI